MCLEFISKKPQIIDTIECRINKLLSPEKIYLYQTSIKGIPSKLRIKILGEDRFLYDESRLAFGLITEIIGSHSLHFFCDYGKSNKKCIENIKNNWDEIENIIKQEINKERVNNFLRIDFLLLFLSKFNYYLYKKFKNDFKIQHKNIRYITRIYKMMRWIQNNYNKQNSLNYRFHDVYGFCYSPDLFEDLMKLSSCRLIKINTDSKERSIYDFSIKKGNLPQDYIDRRTHYYYSLALLKDGIHYSKSMGNIYVDYICFLEKNLDYLYENIYL